MGGYFSALFETDDADEEDFFQIEINQSDEKESVAKQLSKQSDKFKKLIEVWTAKQNALSSIRDENIHDDINIQNIRHIAGVDISFPSNKKDLIHACACLVVLNFETLEIIYKNCKIVHLTSVYIPEYLAFREVDSYIELFDELKSENPVIYPDVVLVDGNGILHPRKFGIASHLGVLLDLPTIGVAKKLFHVDGLENNEEFKTAVKSLKTAGSTIDLIGNSGFLYGKAVRSTLVSTNPIYISVGHKVTLDSAIKIVLLCCKKRIPEPVRWADICSRDYIRKFYSEHVDSCREYSDLTLSIRRFFKGFQEGTGKTLITRYIEV